MKINSFIYTLTRSFGGLKVSKYLTRKHPRILMYHRVGRIEDEIGLNKDVFRNQIRVIKSNFNVMTLKELLLENVMGRVPENVVVITFDDGYYDFFDYAFPIMKNEGISPTLFLTTGFVNGDIWLWPDKIRYFLTNVHSGSIFLEDGSEALTLSSPKEKLWNFISDYCLRLENVQKEDFIKKLYHQFGVEMPSTPPQEYKPVSWSQVRKMMKDGLEVGSHSHSHPILTKLTDSMIYRELRESRELIEKELRVSPDIFCYPNGQPSDFSQEIKDAVVATNYHYAVSAFPGSDPLNDPLEINRYSIDGNFENFEKVLYGLSFLNNKIVR